MRRERRCIGRRTLRAGWEGVFAGDLTTDSGFWDAYRYNSRRHILGHTIKSKPLAAHNSSSLSLSPTLSLVVLFSLSPPPSLLDSTVYPYLSLVNRPVLGTMTRPVAAGSMPTRRAGGCLSGPPSPGYRGRQHGRDDGRRDATVKDIPGVLVCVYIIWYIYVCMCV